MLIAFIIVAVLFSMQINGVIDKPWWLVITASFFVLFLGMIISGRLRFRIEKEVE